MKRVTIAVVAASALGLAACTSPDVYDNRDRTKKGAAMGALMGAATAGIVGKDPIAGAVLGAATGAIVGIAVGGVAFIALIAGLACFFMNKNKKSLKIIWNFWDFLCLKIP